MGHYTGLMYLGKEVMGARLILVEGYIQSSPEEVTHLVAQRMFDRSGDLIGLAEHELRLTGLKPATRYYYSVGTKAGPLFDLSVWLQANAPECVSRAATAFHCKDWLYFRLTRMRATDPSEVAFSYGNFRTRCYDPETARLIGIADLARLVPDVVDGASVTHPLGAAAAAETA